MGKKTRSESNKNYYKNYDEAKNKKARIERHLNKHPNDKQSMERPKADYRRFY